MLINYQYDVICQQMYLLKVVFYLPMTFCVVDWDAWEDSSAF